MIIQKYSKSWLLDNLSYNLIGKGGRSVEKYICNLFADRFYDELSSNSEFIH